MKSEAIAELVGKLLGLTIDAVCIWEISHNVWWTILGISFLANFKAISDKK